MSFRDDYPAGVPCWVDTMQPDVDQAREFYSEIFGWQLDGPGPMPDGGAYYVATLDGKAACGVASSPTSELPTAWNTYVRVDNIDNATQKAQELGATVVASPTDAMPAGRFSVLTDPTGATISLWQAASRKGAEVINQASAWAMSSLQTNDIDSASNFYSELFGWNVEAMDGSEGVYLVRLPGFFGGVDSQPVPRDVVAVMMPAPAGVQNNWSVNFWISHCDDAAAMTEKLGGTVITEPFDAPPFRQAVLKDPQGAVLTVSQLHPY